MSQSEQFYKNLMDNLYDGVYFVDVDRRVTYWNKGAERITGFASPQVCGHQCWDNLLMHVDERGTLLCQSGCPLAATIQDGEVREVDVFLHHASGHRVPVRVRAAPMYDDDGRIVGAVESFSDNSALVAERRRSQTLDRLSLTDSLTGIGNRRYIEAQSQLALAECELQGGQCGLLLIDLDDFKRVNDTYGHETGDRLLLMFAETLRHNLRATDALGRWGGDEFVVVLRQTTFAELAALANKLANLLAQSRLHSGDQPIQVTVSIGAVLGYAGETHAAVFARADAQLYQGKQGGKNSVSCAA